MCHMIVFILDIAIEVLVKELFGAGSSAACGIGAGGTACEMSTETRRCPDVAGPDGAFSPDSSEAPGAGGLRRDLSG